VQQQDQTLKMLGDFLAFRREDAVKPDAVGRWKQDTGRMI